MNVAESLSGAESESQAPRFSVGVLTYNSGKSLAWCLRAVLGQGYARDILDIFLVDAGSSDDTVKIAKDYGVQVYSEVGCTRGGARNICIEKAKSDLLVMLDSDIVIPNGWLSIVDKFFEDDTVVEVNSPYYTPEPRSGIVRRVIYYLTSGWQVHAKGALVRENWVLE